MRLYLDNCCLNRSFDDQSQLRIRLETEATLAVQSLIRSRKLDLVWSYMLDFENSANPSVAISTHQSTATFKTTFRTKAGRSSTARQGMWASWG